MLRRECLRLNCRPKASFALLDAFVASGMNFIDTADVFPMERG
jgi:aryl-alcohol dehydrogenase-like predicted oxidoreductase